MKYIVINQNSEYDIKETSETLSLVDLQKLVDGYIEWVTVDEVNSSGYYINDEGKFTKGINDLATAWWARKLKMSGFPLSQFRDFIAGNAVYMQTNEEGEDAGLTDEQIEEFRSFATIFYQELIDQL